MKKEEKGKLDKASIESLGDGRFRIETFIDEVCTDPIGNYPGYTLRRDIPGGFRINLIQIDVEGTIEISGLRILFRKTGICMYPLPISILRTRPIKEGNPAAYICFAPPLDLRAYASGDLILEMTTAKYTPSSKLYISYGAEFILTESP